MTNTDVNGYLVQIRTQLADVEEYVASERFREETAAVQALYLKRAYLLDELLPILTQISEADPLKDYCE